MTKITKENMQNAHDELLQTFVDKNADYGNSFESSLEEYGLIAALIRMEDKMGRLRTLIKSEAKVKDESILDTLRDLSNYALMASVWFDNKDDTCTSAQQVEDFIFPKKKDGHYSGIRVFKPGEYIRPIIDFEETEDGTSEINLENSAQLRLFLNIHKQNGVINLTKAICQDLFYRIDFTDFYQYAKELRGVAYQEYDKMEIYFNVRNEQMNKVIYMRTNDIYTSYKFHNTEHFKTALENFIDFKNFLLSNRENLKQTCEDIKQIALKQGSKVIKPRTRLDDAFMEMMVFDNDEVTYDIEHGSDCRLMLNEQFIYDMYEDLKDLDHIYYELILDHKHKLSMASTIEDSYSVFTGKTFLDSFQRVLDCGKKVKIINIPQ
nr:MAG TPA: Nucleotide modification associated domain 1 [Caudoviricetes sp.]